MKKLLFIAIYCLWVSSALSQGRYCMSLADFEANRWEPLSSLKLIEHSVSHQVWVGGNDYKFTTEDKDMDALLKKNAFLVEYQDTLYVNLRSLRYGKYKFGNGYAKALVYGQDKVLFIAPRLGKLNLNMGVMFGAIGGALGGALIGSQNIKDRVCYIVEDDGEGEKRSIMMVDDEFMDNLLEQDSEMLNRYQTPEKKEERESAANTLPILLEKNMVSVSKDPESVAQ